jgi:hypothetical protein
MVGKPKRNNTYDDEVAQKRKLTKGYGQVRKEIAGVSSTFRGEPLAPQARNLGGAGGGTGDGTYLSVSLSADQTTNISANDHIEFDTIDADGNIVLQTGAGQADGIFELLGGKRYLLKGVLRPEFSGATGQLVVAWYDITNSAELGKRGIYEAQTHASNNANQPLSDIIVVPSANITVELRIISVTALTALANEYCTATLFEIALGGTAGASGLNFPDVLINNVEVITAGATENIDVSTFQHWVINLTQSTTLTFTGLPQTIDTAVQVVLEFIQDATGGWTVTYADTIDPSAPTIDTTGGAREVVTGFIRREPAGTYVYNLYLVGA